MSGEVLTINAREVSEVYLRLGALFELIDQHHELLGRFCGSTLLERGDLAGSVTALEIIIRGLIEQHGGASPRR